MYCFFLAFFYNKPAFLEKNSFSQKDKTMAPWQSGQLQGPAKLSRHRFKSDWCLQYIFIT